MQWFNMQPPMWGQQPQTPPNYIYIPVPADGGNKNNPLYAFEKGLKLAKKAMKEEEAKKKLEGDKKKDEKKPPMLTYGQALLLSLVLLPIEIPLFVGIVVGSVKITQHLLTLL